MHALILRLPRPCAKTAITTAANMALVGAALALAAAPAEAGTITLNFSNFTDEFAPTEWSVTSARGGAFSTFDGVNGIQLDIPGGTSGAPIFIDFLYDASKLAGLSGDPNAVFRGGTFTFDWTWTFENNGNTLGTSYEFSAVNGRNDRLNEFNGTTIFEALVPSNFTTSGTETVAFSPSGTFGFTLANPLPSTFTTGFSTATISNFSVVANYAPVPGPLPVAGAAAAFAWSRKLRRRLKTAGAMA